MVQLLWDQPGDRHYEMGLDRGVLYPDVGPGVVWNGLTSIDEGVDGGDIESFYVDGDKYLDHAGSEDFVATINALTYPKEFSKYDGKSRVGSLTITGQPRRKFGLSYRTKIGNDTEGLDYGYKLHMVYNVLASPSGVTRETLSDSNSPLAYSWAIVTAPFKLTGFKPTAHYIIDSRDLTPIMLSNMEDILYGTIASIPRLLTREELLELLT